MIRNKIMVLIILLCMVSAYGIPARAADEENEDFDSQLNMLLACGVLDRADLHTEDEELTRADFSVIIYKMIKGDGYTFDDKEVFSDVPRDYPKYNQIMTLYSLGIISDGEEFLPQERITYDEAYAMLIKLLGYERVANRMGGWPNGYRQEAVRLGLHRGDGVYVSSTALIKLLYDSVQAPCLAARGFDGSSVVLTEDDSTTVLKFYYDIEDSTGIIDANSITALYTEGGAGQNSVSIDGTVYSAGDTEAEKYLGYKIDFWYRGEVGDYELIYIDTAGYNKTEKIIADEETVFSDNTLTWYDNRSRKEDIPVTAGIIYNGVAAGTSISERNFVPSYGTITLLDNDKNGRYDVIFIDEYQCMAVKSADEGDMIIIGRDGELLNLSDKQNNLDYKMHDKYDNEISVQFLHEWDILNIKTAPNGNFTDILVSDDYLQGKADGTYEDSIIVDGTEYEYSVVYKKKNEKITLGENVTLYFDCLGYVAAINKGSVSNNVAFLIKAVWDDDEGKSIFKLFTPDGGGKVKILYGCEKVVINDRRYEDKEISEAFCDTDNIDYGSDGTNTLRQLIMYDTDENGNIKKIKTAATEPTDDFYCSYRVKGRNQKTRTRRYEYSVADRQVVLDKAVKIFLVPQNADSVYGDKVYGVKDISYLENLTGKDNIVETYHSTSEKLCAEYVVFYIGDGEDDKSIANDTAIHVFDRWETALNDDDEVVCRMYLYGKNGAITKDLEEGYLRTDIRTPDDLAGLGTGDIVRFSENGIGEINYMEICYSYELNKGYTSGQFVTTAKYIYKTDEVANAISTAEFDITLNKPVLENLDAMSLERFKLYYYDASLKKDKIRDAVISDMRSFEAYKDYCSRAVISRQAGDPRSIVIYKDDKD